MKKLLLFSIIASVCLFTSCEEGVRVSVDAVTDVIPSVDSIGNIHVVAKISDGVQTYTVNVAHPSVQNTLLVAKSLNLLPQVKAQVWFKNQIFTNVETARIDLTSMAYTSEVVGVPYRQVTICPAGFHLENGICVWNF